MDRAKTRLTVHETNRHRNTKDLVKSIKKLNKKCYLAFSISHVKTMVNVQTILKAAINAHAPVDIRATIVKNVKIILFLYDCGIKIF